MEYIERTQVIAHLSRYGATSGQFLSVLNNFSFLQSSGGWIFALKSLPNATVVFFDPIPSRPAPGPISEALTELLQFSRGQILMWTGVGELWKKELSLLPGASSIPIAKEPWVNLQDSRLTGRSAKGVRAGRNQAIRAGVSIEDWTPAIRLNEEPQTTQLLALIEQWQNRSILRTESFLNTVDAFFLKEKRRYFVATVEGKIIGALIVSLIADKESLYFEDIIVGANPPRGVAELLVTEAMTALSQEAKSVSLGAVVHFDWESYKALPFFAQMLIKSAYIFSKLFYPTDGLQLFRRRFRPQSWDTLYFVVVSDKITAWPLALKNLIGLFRVRIAWKIRPWLSLFTQPFRSAPATSFWFSLTTIAFLLFNRGGDIDTAAIDRFAFSPAYPWHEWIYRTIICDFLTYTPMHFAFSLLLGVPLLLWFDRETRKGFRLCFLVFLVMSDDTINYFLLMKPLHFFQPHLFHNILMSLEPAIGNSLVFVAIFGFLTTIRKYLRGWLFPLVMLLVLLGSFYSSDHYHTFVLRLNYGIFFLLGHMAGQLYLNRERKVSQAVSGKPGPRG